MTRDFADFLDALNKEGVEYVVIGGMAVIFHLPYRTTRDIDVLIENRISSAWNGYEIERKATSRTPLASSYLL